MTSDPSNDLASACAGTCPPSAGAIPLVPRRLSEGVAVGRSATREEIAILAGGGFRSLINNRPDGEKDSPMTSAEAEAVASSLGLAYMHIPVEGRNPLEKDVRAFAQALKALPQPIYAFCQSGGRSAALWALASVTEATTEALVTTCARAGYDVSGLAAKMDMRREMLEEDDE
ncbi:MAG: TIGR01244 family phosphatase [Hyphomicrobiaceae bacterium]|nr:MAG: TIGR01244 family phosphatase [Hyphomicrobiaceae bacterium]